MSTIASITSQEVKTGIYIVNLEGEIDVSNLPDLENAVNPLIKSDNFKALIMDCPNLQFIDSKVVGYMAYIHSTLSRKNAHIFISGANETINDILTLVGLNAIIPIMKTPVEALNSIQ